MNAFVTGGTGLLGSYLVPLLAQELKVVRLLVRKYPDREYPPNVEFIQGSLESKVRMREAMEDCTAVFHLAACVTRWEKNPQTYDQVNVQGFRTVMDLAADLKIDRVLYTSTFFALGDSDKEVLNENSRPQPGRWHTHYDRTKIVADFLVTEMRQQGLQIIRLYPGVIYGPGPITQGNIVVQLLLDFLAGKVPGLLGGGGQVWSFAYAEDVAQGIMKAFRWGNPGEDYVLGGDNRSLKEFFDLAGQLLEKQAPRRSIPLWAGWGLGAANELLAKLLGRESDLTRGMISAMHHSWACDSTRAKGQLEYTHRSLDDGLGQTIKWLQRRDRQGVEHG